MSHRPLKKGYLSTLESGLLTTPFKNGAGLRLEPLFGAFLRASRYSEVIQLHGTTDGQNPNLIIAETTYYPLSLPNWYCNALSNRYAPPNDYYPHKCARAFGLSYFFDLWSLSQTFLTLLKVEGVLFKGVWLETINLKIYISILWKCSEIDFISIIANLFANICSKSPQWKIMAD